MAIPATVVALPVASVCRLGSCPEQWQTALWVSLGVLVAALPFAVSYSVGKSRMAECRRLKCISGVEEECGHVQPKPVPATGPAPSTGPPAGMGEASVPDTTVPR
jgi:hypothetical protein